MRRTGSAAKAASLEDWLELMLHLYADRVLPFEIAAARIAGTLTDRARGRSCAGFRGHRHRRHGREPRPHRAHAQPASLRALGGTRARSLSWPASAAQHFIADRCATGATPPVRRSARTSSRTPRPLVPCRCPAPTRPLRPDLEKTEAPLRSDLGLLRSQTRELGQRMTIHISAMMVGAVALIAALSKLVQLSGTHPALSCMVRCPHAHMSARHSTRRLWLTTLSLKPSGRCRSC